MTTALDHRARLLRAALGFLALKPRELELRRLPRCFDNWRGIGDIVVAMARARNTTSSYAATTVGGWRAIFFQSGFEHSLTSHAGAGWAPSLWEAVQRAAGDALYKLRAGEAASGKSQDSNNAAS